MSGYRFAPYESANRSAVAHFYRQLSQGDSQFSATYLDWKYRRNPYLNDRYLLLAWADSELVGMLGAFGASWEAHTGERAMLPCLSDTLVAPEHRGGPLFGRMVEELLERLKADRVPWLLDFADQPAAPSLLMRGWKAIGPWGIAVAPPEGHSRSIRQTGRVIRGGRSGVPIKQVSGPPVSLMAALIADLPRRQGVRHVRDTEYLAWRYRNPSAIYFHLIAGSGEPVGFIVCERRRTRPDLPMTIIEVEATSDDLWIDLVETAVGTLPGSALTMWTRDLSAVRYSALEALGLQLHEPSGKITRDSALPNLLVRLISAPPNSSPFASLDRADTWDLRGVCGRSAR